MGVEPDLAEHLRRLEVEIANPTVRHSPDALEALMTADFVEFGSSGRRYDRAAAVTAVLSRAPQAVLIEDFTVRELSPTVALVTYRSVVERAVGDSPRVALRSSVWCRQDDGQWRMAFHQGTPAATPG